MTIRKNFVSIVSVKNTNFFFLFMARTVASEDDKTKIISNKYKKNEELYT